MSFITAPVSAGWIIRHFICAAAVATQNPSGIKRIEDCMDVSEAKGDYISNHLLKLTKS